ncbi:GTP pyrophosphokinase [Chengkuizengella axinellae]|uniref:GTP pyrophosphokinase family protein n=1 Tax=Chengkuizengella axinellae TaxID=3064388 RepID=A0ABT9IYR9_9BACL|nr:GTP pyrophosphokinase family protein [Chengkuizengella sp. 2205SS18-9]MDP5273945.1 GTP pyrophosphokinase family protein [Chengkuizengella sp. 2205SS18-9]
MKAIKAELIRFMMSYKFALSEISTKIDILKQEFQYIHEYNPFEHVNSRMKTLESIINKAKRKGSDFSLKSIKENIRDIAGVRIICSFVSDIYVISEMLEKQKDIHVIESKDYIQNPKPNGYQSLHLIVQIPVFMSDREEHVCVEIQIRTIAMDFWASLEHKIYYKYNKEIPKTMRDELKEAAITAAQLDAKMEKINQEVNKIKETDTEDELRDLMGNNERLPLPYEIME